MIFPLDNPLYIIQSLKDGVQKNIDQNNAMKVIKSCFPLGHYMGLFRVQSPLEELRKGNLEKAIALIDLHDDSKQYAWKLLLMWELKEQGKLEEARGILNTLRDAKLKEYDYCLTAQLITYLLSRCTGIDDDIILQIISDRLKDEEKKQFFKYLILNESFDVYLITLVSIVFAKDTEKEKSLRSYLLWAQQEIYGNSQANICTPNTYLAKQETLLQIDKALKIKDGYEKALALSEILPNKYCPSENFESVNYYEYESYLMSCLLPEQTIALAEAGKIDAASKMYDLLNTHGWLHYNDSVPIAIANQQAKNGDSQAARTTIGLAIKEDSYSSYCDRIRNFSQYKRDKNKNNPTTELLEAIISTPFMCERLIENKDMWDCFIDLYLLPEDQQAKKDSKPLIDFILHETKQNPDRGWRIYIIGKAAVVLTKSGDVDNALTNLDYLMQLIEEIPGDKNKITALLDVAKYYSLTGQIDEAINAVNKASQLTQRERKEWRRDCVFRDIAFALITMGLYERAINVSKNISNKKDQESVLEAIAIDRIEKSDDGISIAKELMREISDQGCSDRIKAKMAMHHVKKGEFENAQILMKIMNKKNKYLAVKAHNQMLLDQYIAGDKSAVEKLVINDDFMCHNDTEALAIAEIRAGLGELALQTAKLVGHDFLFDLADTCVQVGDKETFNKIIPIALNDISSACKIAGLLCRKYPGSAAEIFNLLLTYPDH